MASHQSQSCVETEWLIGSASVTGPGHVKVGLPNQDAYEVRTSADGRVVAAVVSDGAGSAPRSDEGSRNCVRMMSQRLLEIGETQQADIPLAIAKDEAAGQRLLSRVVDGLQRVRGSLSSNPVELRQYAHTFTGLVLTPRGALLVQIGDSPALMSAASIATTADGKQGIDYLAEFRIPEVEKGEYANEAYFVTQADWTARLRPLAIPADRFEAFFLMSDGAESMVISRGQPYKPYIGPNMARMLKAADRAGRDQVLFDALSDPRCDAATADDKTLVVICRKSWQKHAHLPHVSLPPEITPPPQPEPLPKPESTTEVTGSSGQPDVATPVTSPPAVGGGNLDLYKQGIPATRNTRIIVVASLISMVLGGLGVYVAPKAWNQALILAQGPTPLPPPATQGKHETAAADEEAHPVSPPTGEAEASQTGGSAPVEAGGGAVTQADGVLKKQVQDTAPTKRRDQAVSPPPPPKVDKPKVAAPAQPSAPAPPASAEKPVPTAPAAAPADPKTINQ